MARSPGKPFQKGQSGNPAGRPKIPADVREYAKAYTIEALDALRDEIAKGKGASRVTAAVAILDRAWGKPTMTLDASVRKDVRDFTDAELNALIAADLAERGLSIEEIVEEQRKNSGPH